MADPRTLRVGIDGRELIGRPTGVGRYVGALLKEWAAAATRCQFAVFVPAPPPAELAALGPRIEWIVEAASSAGTAWEQTRLSRAARQARLDVFFAAGYTAPLRLACPSVVAIYDVSFFAHPEWFTWREGLRRRWLTRAAAKRARAIVTISEFSATEIVRHLGVGREKIVLAPPGPPAITLSPDADRAASRPPVVLFVGSLFNRRRIPDLLRGFALAARAIPEARLVLVGDNRTHPPIDPLTLARHLHLDGRVEWRQYVDDAELAALYGGARVFAFLSDYEGFAMTPFEAIAHGVAAVLLDTPVAREVYGSAARLVSPDPADVSEALINLLSDAGAHAALVAAGRDRLAQLSWSRTAAVVLAALERAAVQP